MAVDWEMIRAAQALDDKTFHAFSVERRLDKDVHAALCVAIACLVEDNRPSARYAVEFLRNVRNRLDSRHGNDVEVGAALMQEPH